MGYYMRFITGDERDVGFDQIEAMLVSVDSQYALQRSQFEFEQVTDVFYGGVLIGQIEINEVDDEIFEDDVSAFREMIGEPVSAEDRSVLAILDQARLMVVVEALWKGTDAENTLTKFDPLWAWLFANRTGILQADNEGFYDANGLLVERKFML
jgi:hypothetical protein